MFVTGMYFFLDGKMTQALTEGNLKDVRSVLEEEDFAIKDYLTEDRLIELYASVSVVDNFIFSLQLQLTIYCLLLFNILIFCSVR